MELELASVSINIDDTTSPTLCPPEVHQEPLDNPNDVNVMPLHRLDVALLCDVISDQLPLDVPGGAVKQTVRRRFPFKCLSDPRLERQLSSTTAVDASSMSPRLSSNLDLSQVQQLADRAVNRGTGCRI
jgi:hypothetical protein